MKKIGIAFGKGKAVGVPVLGLALLGFLIFMAGRKTVQSAKSPF